MERRTGKIRRAFSRMHMALDGWMLARAPASPAQGPTTMDLGISIFLIFVRCVALRNLEYCCSKLFGTYLSDLLLRTLVVGRRQQSESIEAALDME